MARGKNPFIFARVEHETNTTLYMPDALLDWVSSTPMRFEGCRGSGKSSILSALTWQVTWGLSDKKIEGSHKVTQFLRRPQHIGVYHRVEDMDVHLWEAWENIVSKEISQGYFGTYIEFVYLDLLLEAIDGIRLKSRAYFRSLDAETQLVNDLLCECFPPKNRPRLSEITFSSLRRIVSDTHRGIRSLVFNRALESEIKGAYKIVGPGSLVQKFGDLFLKYYPENKEWLIMPLLDDCNFLRENQVKVVNSAIAKAKYPVAYKLTSLSGLYPTQETLLPERPLIVHLLKPVYLPSNYAVLGEDVPTSAKDSKEYEKRINGVCRARVAQQYKDTDCAQFELSRILGQFKLEEALWTKLRKSENTKVAYDLYKLALEHQKKTGVLSVTSPWLSYKKIRVERELDAEDPEKRERLKRQNSSQYKKKWDHVAAVALCKELKIDFPYFGLPVVMYLSGGSIRELLRIMSEIWNVSKMDVSQFIKKDPIDRDLQAVAIREAAKVVYNNIETKPLSSGSNLKKICSRLGTLFGKCQSYPYIITTAETASIQIASDKICPEVSNIITKAITSGIMLKKTITGKATSKTLISLHPILSPNFAISFRNPFFYPEPITPEQLSDLFLGDDRSAQATIEQILKNRMQRHTKRYKNVSKAENTYQQMALFAEDVKE